MRQPENIRKIETLGIDWMGFIFFARSPRNVETLPDYMPSRQKRVGVFVNPTAEFVIEKVRDFGLDLVQLHGKETPEFCQKVKQTARVQVIKAFSIASADDLSATELYDGACDYLLFDTKCESVGGSGQRFNWAVLDRYKGKTPFLLSGGIGLENVDDVLQFSHPQLAGLDLNSKFETAPAIKDFDRLSSFITEIRKTKTI